MNDLIEKFTNPVRLGIDIGGVLAGQLSERARPDNTFDHTSPPKAGALEFIANAVKIFGAKNVFIVSRAVGAHKVAANWCWLVHHGFFATGLLPENVVIFDGPRSEKRTIVERLGITVMLDDRLEVLAEMPAGVMCVAYCPAPAEFDRYRDFARERPVHVIDDFPGFWDLGAN